MGSKFVINSLPKTARKRNLVTPGLKNHAKRLFGTKMLAYKRSMAIDESVLVKNADIIKKMTEAGLFEVRVDAMNGPVLNLSEILKDAEQPPKKEVAPAPAPAPPAPVVEKVPETEEEEDSSEVIEGEFGGKTKSELLSMLVARGVELSKNERKRLRKSEIIAMLKEKS